ncbi:MAG: YiiX/YebB-like N1pC/P60 family cysteine hydrolase [Pirellulaceae bacterium]
MSRPRTREDLVHVGGVLALLLPLLAGCAMLAGCASGLPAARSSRRPAVVHDEQADAQVISRNAARMEVCLATLRRLRGDQPAREPDYLLPSEHDLVERTLTEYLACRDELQQIAIRHTSPSSPAGLSQLAIARQAECDIALTGAALDDDVLRRALNQEFHRSGIPEGTCDRIMHEVTDSNLVRSLPEPTPGGSVVPASYGEDIQSAPSARDARRRIEGIIRRRSLLLPVVENEMWHLPPTHFLTSTARVAGNQLHRCRGAFVASLGRLQNPAARPLEFTPAQRQQIRGSLQPGDVLLTYTEGFASNLLIPGAFKHAATFVGTEDDRRRAGIPADVLAAHAGPSNERLPQVLRQLKTTDGETADVVESVAEGVLLSHFDRILTTRVNRLVVLRPRLAPEERASQLVDVLSFVGDEYDFSYDLTDGSDQVCTEVVYRSLHGRGGIAFPLTKHAGRFTLTADEILKYHLEAGANQFECVLIVDEEPRSPGKATIHFADEGHAWISRLPGLRSSAPSPSAPPQYDGDSHLLRRTAN